MSILSEVDGFVSQKGNAMFTRIALTPVTALMLAILGSGCFDSGAKTALNEENRSGKSASRNEETAAADQERRRDLMDDDIPTPESSMRRDLDALMAKESRQRRLIEEMQSELSENQSLMNREEKRLAEIHNQINRYQEALGGRMAMAPGRAERPERRMHEEYSTRTERDMQSGYETAFNRPPAAVNVAQGMTPDAGQRQYVIKTNIPYEEFQAMQGPSRPAANEQQQQPQFREAGAFAGAPRGYPRTDVAFSRNQTPVEPDMMETLIWDPNAPGQPELPGVVAAARTRQPQQPSPSTPGRNQPNPAPESMAAINRNESSYNQNEYRDASFGGYANEPFSPDMYFGRGG